MKLCSAQIQPIKGDIDRNIQKHIFFINSAIENGADLIFFPELSLTGYEPTLAKNWQQVKMILDLIFFKK